MEPFDIPEDIWITDTTFRDGQQSRPPFTVEQISKLFDFLQRIGGEKGVIRFSEFFLYSEKDKKAVEACLAKGYKYPEVTGWIRAVKKDFELVKNMGLKETGILVSCSDYHIFLKLNKTRKQAMDIYLDTIKEALNHGVIPRCHFEDVTRADVYGFVVPFAIELMKLSKESKMPVKIRLCDTLGLGLSYPGIALPRSIPKLIMALRHDAGVPSEYLEWHGHNDFHKVHINTATAWLYGASAANASLFGIGERTGNSPIEALIFEYIGIKGGLDGIDTTAINEAADYYREMGVPIPHNFPFVGEDFNMTRAGIHADGVIKNPEIYTIFDTARILKRPITIGITDKSGVAGIALWINMHLRLPEKDKVDKHHPGVLKIYEWVMEEYTRKRTTAISDEEMLKMVRRHIPELFKSEFDQIKENVRSGVQHLIEDVAQNPVMHSFKKAEMEKYLKKVISQNPFIQLIAVTDKDGRRVTDNISRVIDKSKYDQFTKGDFTDCEWFINPMKTGKTSVTDFYVSKITNALCITVSTPVFDKKEEHILGILEFDIRFQEAAKL
ncbi:MAG: histone-lysine N-methyltransferase [Spirochaetes bacterium]|nr:histone-lysine N-methyltransferase [Spirochaetota bacterium]